MSRSHHQRWHRSFFHFFFVVVVLPLSRCQCRWHMAGIQSVMQSVTQSVGPSFCQSIGQSIITRFGCRRLTNQTRYRSAKIYGSNKIYSALSLAQTPTLPLARALDAKRKIVKLYVFGHQNAARLIIGQAQSDFSVSCLSLCGSWRVAMAAF